MDSEKKNLQKHFYDRTLSMLKTIEHLENNNIRNKVKQIAEDALKNLINVIKIYKIFFTIKKDKFTKSRYRIIFDLNEKNLLALTKFN